VAIYWIHSNVHERTDDVHARPPPELELFPVGLRIGVVLSLDVQMYSSCPLLTFDLPMSCKDFPDAWEMDSIFTHAWECHTALPATALLSSGLAG